MQWIKFSYTIREFDVNQILGCAWVASPWHAELEGERSPERPWKEAGKERKRPDAESDDEFDFGSAGEAKGGSAEEFESGRKGSSWKKEPKPAKHGGDEVVKGEKTKDSLEKTNSDESENRSEEGDSVLMFDSETLNQLKAM